MSNIIMRYILKESSVFGMCFVGRVDVYDQNEKRVICVCSLQKDADMIVGLLNKAHNKDIVEEMGG